MTAALIIAAAIALHAVVLVAYVRVAVRSWGSAAALVRELRPNASAARRVVLVLWFVSTWPWSAFVGLRTRRDEKEREPS